MTLKDELQREFYLTMEGISNQLFTARYQLYLPQKAELQAQLNNIIDNAQSLESNR